MNLENKNLKILSDDELIRDTQNLASEERRVTTIILKHLAEIERRRLFASLGYSSLFEYCLNSLGYSESSAYRRIEAMRLIKAVPEIEEKIESGVITITVAAQVQKFFRQEISEASVKKCSELTHEKKLEILNNLEGKSSRAAEQQLLALSSEPVRLKNYEKQRAVSAHLTEVRFLADAQLLKDLEKVKGLLAHHSLKSLAEVIAKMAKISIEQLDPSLKKVRPQKPKLLPAPEVINSNSKLSAPAKLESERYTSTQNSNSRYVPAALKRLVWTRDKSQCSYIDPRTKRKCESTHFLQIDHLIPHACGGQTTEENLRLLCFHHNQWMAQDFFGPEKIEAKRSR